MLHDRGFGAFLILVLWWMTWLAAAGAAEVVDFGSRIPSIDELEQALKPNTGDKARGFERRGIKRINPTPMVKTEAPPEDFATISMEITFDFNSDRLSGHSVETLYNVGSAILRPSLKNYRFRIEGHTDSTGTAAYNQRLSERRAKSVRNYLLSNFQIAPTRLRMVGKGEESPKEGIAPDDPANRRVQMTTLDSIQEP